MDTIIETKGVTRNYGQGDIIVRALRGVDLVVEKGEFTAMAGPSGSGKTTLLNVIGAMDKPTEGKVLIEGKDITVMSMAELSHLRRNRLGFVFQNYSLLPVLTAIENAEYVLMIQGVPMQERREKVMAILKEVGLEGMENRFPRELSGGQQQRVAIARALASDPALILADEPTANVDTKTGAALLELMQDLNENKGVTFFLATHEKDVMRATRRLVVLKDGTIDYDGEPGGGIDLI